MNLPILPVLEPLASIKFGDAKPRILLDGIASNIAVESKRFACSTGARIAIFELNGSLSIKSSVPMSDGNDLHRLLLTEDGLFALSRDKVLWSRRENDEHWQEIPTIRENIRDIVAVEDRLFILSRKRLVSVARNADGKLEPQFEIEVSERARHLWAFENYIAAYGPSTMWIGALRANEIETIYTADDKYPYPVALGARNGEFVIADHLAGVFSLADPGNGKLELSRHERNILHPYAVAHGESGWIIAGEQGTTIWRDNEVAETELSDSPVTELHNIGESLLAVAGRRLILFSGAREKSCFELPGYSFAADRGNDLIACATEKGLYVLGEKNEACINPVSLSGQLRAVQVGFPFAYLATTDGLACYRLERPFSNEPVCQINDSGEPVALAMDASGSYIYWSCGLSLNKVKLEATGRMEIVDKFPLGCYFHAMAISGEHFYAASNEGGLFYGKTSRLRELAQSSDLMFVADVAVNDKYVMAATAKKLVVFSHAPTGQPVFVSQLDNQSDLSTCAFDGDSLIFVAGRTLYRAKIAGTGAEHRIEIINKVNLPFAAARIRAFDGCVLVTGKGGLLVVETTS